MRLSIFLLAIFALSSCKQSGGPGPHATVFMRDGSSVTGNLESTSSAEIRLSGDDKVERTIPMSQVQAVNYDAPALPPATAGLPVPATQGAPMTSPAEAPPDPAHDNHYHPVETAITTRTYEVPVGADIPVRTEETIDSARAADGQTFPAELTRDVRDAAGNVVIPRGANAVIVIRSESKGGAIHGASDLVLDLASVSIDGREYRLHTRDLEERGRDGVGVNKRTGEFVGGGAAIGAIIGAIAGHGKGAAIGAGSGAGAGVVTEIATKGRAIRIPVESVLTFHLSRALLVTAAQ